MSNIRIIKDKARTRLHARMKVKTFCFANGPEGSYEKVFLRVNSKDENIGDLQGIGPGYAERRETIPKLIFRVDEHIPKRKNIYSVGPEEAYEVDMIDPRDGITITAIATRLSKKNAAKYDYPER